MLPSASCPSLLQLRSLTLLLLPLACATDDASRQAPWPTEGWTSSSLEQQGLDPAPLITLRDSISAGTFGNVDRMVVVRNGYLVMSERFPRDYRAISRGVRGPLGCGVDACEDSTELHQFNYLHPDFHPYYQGRDVHSLQSVTKSVAATLIGVAIAQREIAGVEAPLLSFFEDYDLSRVDPRLQNATLADLLTMRSGIEWHESDRPLDETNTTLQLEYADDWIQFTLDQPMDAAPGEKWVYNSGGSHLMSGIIKAATGEYIDAYAEQYLFGPLGVDDHHWKKTPRGYPDTEGGLYLEAEQLAKIGYLYLRDGVWDGGRILPQRWVAEATARHVDSVGVADWGYGYQWWRLDTQDTDIWAGLGFGGQFLLVLPAYDLVGVINSWNVFGGNQGNVLAAFIDALRTALGAGGEDPQGVQ
jgi:CubicO group peptidase (beta-lactamase class C family)